MKKLYAFLLVLALCLALCVPAFAATGVSAREIMMGDLDSNKKVNASDARLALRVASKLEENKYDPNAYDADGNGKLTAADARIILRVAAKLQSFDTGFDADGVPNVIKAFKTGVFDMDATMKAEGTEMDMKVTLAENGVYMDIGDFLELGTITGVLVIDKNYYAVGKLSDGTRTALMIPENMIKDMGEDMDIAGMVSEMSELFKADFDTVSEAKTPDGKDAICYSKTGENGLYSAYYVDYTGKLLVFEGGTINADGTKITIDTVITFNSFSGTIDRSIFNINSYVVM